MWALNVVPFKKVYQELNQCFDCKMCNNSYSCIGFSLRSLDVKTFRGKQIINQFY